jgi:hypothetical protein
VSDLGGIADFLIGADPLSIAIGAVALAGVALAIYAFGDIRDAFEDAFGDVVELPHEAAVPSKRLGRGEAGETPDTAVTHNKTATARHGSEL